MQADLQSAIQSRLQWSLQAVKAELDVQQRQEQHRKTGPSPAVAPPSSQLELPVTAGLESLKPYQGRRGKEPQLTREKILKAYSLSTTDFAPRPAEAGCHKRRTSVAMS